MNSYRIRNRFIYLLYRLGFKSVKEDIDIINFLLSIDLNPYSKKIINYNIEVIDNINILSYTDLLRDVLSNDLLNVKYETIDKKFTLCNTTIGLWCSDRNQMKLDQPDIIIREFLLLCKELVIMDDKLRQNINNGICLFNLRKINQYIINIRSILNDILISL